VKVEFIDGDFVVVSKDEKRKLVELLQELFIDSAPQYTDGAMCTRVKTLYRDIVKHTRGSLMATTDGMTSASIPFSEWVFKYKWTLACKGDCYYLFREDGVKTPTYRNTGDGNMAQVLHGLLGEARILEQKA
jgi:hypothetical protein